MIINSLLFIIICIFVYESFQILNKMTEEYFITHVQNEKFINLSSDPNKNDISKTIAINCKAFPDSLTKKMVNKPVSNESLDTPYYSQYKPLEYDKKREYYWRVDKLVEEGIRRSKDDEIEIEKVQNLLDNETDPDKQEIYEEELKLFNWRKNILSLQDTDTGLDRIQEDIISDYYPSEIGMSRPWIERHSHIPNYSY